MTVVDTELDFTVLEDLDFAPRCEGLKHHTGNYGHDHGVAEWHRQSTCPHCKVYKSLLLCDGRAKALYALPVIICGTCEEQAPTEQFKVKMVRI